MTGEAALVEPAIWAAEWLPPAEVTLRGTVVLLPGRGEPPLTYARLGKRLAVDGYRVVTGPTTTDGLVPLLRSDPGRRPLVVVGADTGALTALSAATTENGVAGVVLAGSAITAPGVTAANTATKRSASIDSWDEELDARTACPVHRKVLSSNPDVVRGSIWAPSPEPVPAGDPQVPVLAVHGADDVIAPSTGVRAALEGRPNVRLVEVAGGRHDVLNDVHHRSVAAEIVQFLEQLRTGGPILSEHRTGEYRNGATTGTVEP